MATVAFNTDRITFFQSMMNDMHLYVTSLGNEAYELQQDVYGIMEELVDYANDRVYQELETLQELADEVNQEEYLKNSSLITVESEISDYFGLATKADNEAAELVSVLKDDFYEEAGEHLVPECEKPWFLSAWCALAVCVMILAALLYFIFISGEMLLLFETVWGNVIELLKQDILVIIGSIFAGGFQFDLEEICREAFDEEEYVAAICSAVLETALMTPISKLAKGVPFIFRGKFEDKAKEKVTKYTEWIWVLYQTIIEKNLATVMGIEDNSGKEVIAAIAIEEAKLTVSQKNVETAEIVAEIAEIDVKLVEQNLQELLEEYKKQYDETGTIPEFAY